MTKKDLKIPQFNQITPYSRIPACLQEVFGFYKKHISQEKIMGSSLNPKLGMSLPEAGIFVGKYGFTSSIIVNNIEIFDPTWFNLDEKKLTENLKLRRRYVGKYYKYLIDLYLKYIKSGGKIKFDTIGANLLKKCLSRDIPIIMELASTFLYKKAKSGKPGSFNEPFDGEVEGHGVVIAGFDGNKFKIIDPNIKNNPYSKNGIYWIGSDELLASFGLLEGKSLLLIKK
ncbi:MAG: hypothetical protein ABIG65_00960 [Patescibacteria group bacterium]